MTVFSNSMSVFNNFTCFSVKMAKTCRRMLGQIFSVSTLSRYNDSNYSTLSVLILLITDLEVFFKSWARGKAYLLYLPTVVIQRKKETCLI